MRWAIDGQPDGATCKKVRTRPDLVMDHASLGALLLGGVRPSVAGRRSSARMLATARPCAAAMRSSLRRRCLIVRRITERQITPHLAVKSEVSACGEAS